MHPDDSPACFRAALGLYACEPLWLSQAVNAVIRGLWPMRALDSTPQAISPRERLYSTIGERTALIRIVGSITKGLSKFTGTSTVMTRQALRQAAADPDIDHVLLAIDSPGGHVAGVYDLAEDIRRFSKPIAAYIEDLGASAAYWLASQAQRVSANRPAEIGSIGVFAVLEDLSQRAEREGVTVRVVSTGPFKGAGVPGTPITEPIIDLVQEHVNHIGNLFFSAVRSGRGLTTAQITAITTGQTWLAAQAQERKLIDAVETFDDALKALQTLRPRRRLAAERRAQQLASFREAL